MLVHEFTAHGQNGSLPQSTSRRASAHVISETDDRSYTGTKTITRTAASSIAKYIMTSGHRVDRDKRSK